MSVQSIKPLSGVEPKVIEFNDYAIHYYVSGEKGLPLLVMLHAAFCNHHCFDSQHEFFNSKFRVVTLDMLGHGNSEIGNTKDTLDFTVTHILAMMEKEGYSKIHLVGASMGSLIAQYFAVLHPDMVESLTVLGGYNINPVPKEIKKAQITEGLKWMARALFSMESFRKYVARVSAYHIESQQQIYEMTKQFSFNSFKPMRGLGNITKISSAQKIGCRLLIICGQYDIDLALNAAQEWHRHEPNSEMAIVENAGHLANMDNPEAFNSRLLAFLTK